MAVLDRFRSYPYANTRVRAMRGDLISDNEYRKLEKMTFSEMAEFLSNRGYGDAIDSLADDHRGATLIERAVKQRLADVHAKLLRIADEPVERLLRIYYRKFDLQNLKGALRRAGSDEDDDIDDMLLPPQDIDRATLHDVASHDSVAAAVSAAVEAGAVPAVFDDVDTDDRAAVEDALDRHYYRTIVEEAEDTAGSELFKEFLQLEAALKNVAMVLRMKEAGREPDAILDRVIDLDGRQPVDLKALAHEETVEDAVHRVTGTDAGRYVDTGWETLADVQQGLDRYKLERGITMLHRHQLNVNPVLGFMICYEIEARNLRMLAQAKLADVGEDFLDRHLIRGVAG